MPTYEYACRSCEEHLEVVQSFRDEPLKECPACGGELKKVFGNVGIVFKGSGFYKTDSRSKSGSKSSSSESKSDSKSESKSDSKPESKSDSSSSSSSSSSEKASAAS